MDKVDDGGNTHALFMKEVELSAPEAPMVVELMLDMPVEESIWREWWTIVERK